MKKFSANAHNAPQGSNRKASSAKTSPVERASTPSSTNWRRGARVRGLKEGGRVGRVTGAAPVVAKIKTSENSKQHSSSTTQGRCGV